MGIKKLAVIGDSITHQNSPGDEVMRDHGYANWFQALSGNVLDYDSENVFGYSGQTTDVIMQFTDTMLETQPDYVFLLGGTNDITGKIQQAVRSPLSSDDFDVAVNNVAQSIIHNLQTIVEQSNAANAQVVMMTILPRAWWTEYQPNFGDPNSVALGVQQVDAAVQTILKVNQWIKDYASENDMVLVADAFDALIDHELSVDPVTNNGSHVRYDADTNHIYTSMEPKTEFFDAAPEQRDMYGDAWRGELHPGIQGAKIMGQSLKEAMRDELSDMHEYHEYFNDLLEGSINADDTYYISNKSNGETPVAGNHMNGEIISGWSMTNGWMSRHTATSDNHASVTTDAKGTIWQNFDINLSSQDGYGLIYQTFTHNDPIEIPVDFDRANDMLSFQLDLSVTEARFLQQVKIDGYFTNSHGKKIANSGFEGFDNSDKGYWPSEFEGTFFTPQVEVPIDAVGVQYKVYFNFDMMAEDGSGQEAGAKISLSNIHLSHVTDSPELQNQDQETPIIDHPPMDEPEPEEPVVDTPPVNDDSFNYGTDLDENVYVTTGDIQFNAMDGDDYFGIYGHGVRQLLGGDGNDAYGIDRDYLTADDIFDGGNGNDRIIFKHSVEMSTLDLAGVKNIETIELRNNSKLALNSTMFNGLANNTLMIDYKYDTPIRLELNLLDLNPDHKVSVSGNIELIVTDSSKAQNIINLTGNSIAFQNETQSDLPTISDDGTTQTGTFSNDKLGSRGGEELIMAEDGNDYVGVWGEGVTYIFGGHGNDTFGFDRNYLGSEDIVNGGEGTDRLLFKHSVALTHEDISKVSSIEEIELRYDSSLELSDTLYNDLDEMMITLIGNPYNSPLNASLDLTELKNDQFVTLSGDLNVILSNAIDIDHIYLADDFSGTVHSANVDITDLITSNGMNNEQDNITQNFDMPIAPIDYTNPVPPLEEVI